ncbi:MAG TPA: C40 family peptidase [Moheibacter sp.]|nr:C40 family peptidase [Moheibacter sp.]
MKFRGFYLLLFSYLFIVSCSTSRKISYKSSAPKTKSESVVKSNVSSNANFVLKEAYKFIGTPYQYGGTTKRGMDCSGLVINAYESVGVTMPRISRDQANAGKEIRLREVKEGDLVFFKTSGSNINHVGIVEKVKNGEVFFIHSSTSKGVIVSSMEETYWNKRFVKATRVL